MVKCVIICGHRAVGVARKEQEMRQQYIEPDNSYYKPSRDPNEGQVMLVVIMTILFVTLTAVLAVVFFKKTGSEDKAKGAEGSEVSSFISAATPTPTPAPPLESYQNPLLYPAKSSVTIDKEAKVVPEADPSARGLVESVTMGGTDSEEYVRGEPVFFSDPINYGKVPGILTFRGNNFRNCASYGNTEVKQGKVEQLWEFSGIESKLASTKLFEWKGLRWTGQPLLVQWPDSMKAAMNLKDSAKSKAGLVEVIAAALDGKIYFMDLETGDFTREPINVGASLKGTPALDPRGYPLLYVGQTDDNSDSGKFGMYVYSLVDGICLYSYEGTEDGAYRNGWHAFDSSPIVSGETDTLIWPCENGLIYTIKLNTVYTPGSSMITLNPEVCAYKYIFNDNTASHMGVESSIALYGNYGYFVDNTQNLVCLDINAMKMVWCVKLGDDSDVTPVVDEENGIPYVYCGCEVDNQGQVGEYNGAAYVYKINGLTGEVIWQTSEACYTYNGQTSETDQSGGCFGNPIVGKRTIGNLVIFSYSMTNGLLSGNKLVAYDKTLGTRVWDYKMNIYSYSSPVDIYDSEGNAYIMIGDSIGQIHLINASNGKRVTYIQTARLFNKEGKTTSGVCFEASPVVWGNTAVIGTTSGSVFGIKIS